MTRETTFAPEPDDPDPTVRWELVYRDDFDRETPPSTEVTGVGIVPGLIELWARFLFESVQLNNGRASRGFSSFTLYFDGDRSPIYLVGEIEGQLEAAGRIKHWVFGDVRHTTRRVIDEADLDLLRAIACANARLRALDVAGDEERILDCALGATDASDFIESLGRIAVM